jgi:cystathionine beta-lyase/cystathionine gamma-synthase
MHINHIKILGNKNRRANFMDRGLNTRCLHLEETEGTVNNYGAISFPIYQTATYAHPEVGQSTGYDYSRLQNPTKEHLEKIVAGLEGGTDALALSSGMAAITLLMERAQKNAILLADWLKEQSIVTKVIYPGLPEHPGYEIIKKQARGFGSMITFNVDTKEHALAILKKVRMIKFAESLGGVETLITYPTTQTHADVPEEIREKNGITACTLRLSTGIEDGEDLIAELETVFKNINETD